MASGSYSFANFPIRLNMRELEFDVFELRKNLYVLGGAYAFVYLIKSRRNILIDTGTAFWGERILQALKDLNVEKLDAVLLTHSHYDHVGGLPIISRDIPIDSIYAHPYMERVLSSQRALKLINELNLKELELLSGRRDYTFQPFGITEHALEGRILKVDGLEIEIYETPGHTRDSVSYYIKPYNVLVPGEALGVPNKDDTWIFPQFLSDYRAYLKSMEKLSSLDIEVLGLPHEHLIVGRDRVKAFVELSRRITLEYIEDLRKTIAKHSGNLNSILEELFERYYEPKGARQPVYAFRENLKAQVIKLMKEKLDHV